MTYSPLHFYPWIVEYIFHIFPKQEYEKDIKLEKENNFKSEQRTNAHNSSEKYSGYEISETT